MPGPVRDEAVRWPAAPPAPRGRALAAWIVAAIAMLAVLAALDAPLRSDEAGSGIVSLELAVSPERAAEIVGSWDATGARDQAAFGLGLDYLYAAVYALALAGACLAAGRRLERARRSALAGLAVPLAWAALAAGLFDWLENTALAVVLLDEPASPWPELALGFAAPKFALLAATIVFALGGLLLARRASARPAR